MKSKAAKPSFPPALRAACQVLDDKKAEEVSVLAVGEQSSITDYLVLATGTSEPHLRALRVELEKAFDGSGVRLVGVDTEQGSGWTVIDAFDVMVHLFSKENRTRYRLDQLWADARPVELAEVLKPAKKPRAPRAAGAAAKPAAKRKTRASS